MQVDVVTMVVVWQSLRNIGIEMSFSCDFSCSSSPDLPLVSNYVLKICVVGGLLFGVYM